MDSNSDSGCVATGLSFNLNLHPPPAEQKRLSHDDDDDDNGVDQHMENLDTGVLDQQIKNQEVQVGNSNWMEVITRIDRESKRMADMVANMVDKCSTMHQQLMDLIINSNHQLINNHMNGEDDHHPHLKRKSDHDHNDADNSSFNNNNCHLSELSCVSDGNCCKRIRLINCKPKITTSFIRVDPSDTSLAVKDGYQWRKYGQKVTRDNPSPRAYFKCSFAPICPVKKKVQKSVEDPTVLVATYEGEHNHKQAPSVGSLNMRLSTPACSTINIPASASTLINVVSPSSNYLSSPSSSSPLDRFIHQNQERAGTGSDEEDHDNEDLPRSPLQHWIIQQMASSLTKDPSFTSTLAAAISDKMF